MRRIDLRHVLGLLEPRDVSEEVRLLRVAVPLRCFAGASHLDEYASQTVEPSSFYAVGKRAVLKMKREL